MSIKRTLLREFEVAFSRSAQPLWFRLIKYLILGSLILCFWKSQLFLKIIAIIFILSLTVHFWVRYKTKAWTQSYGLWDYKENKSKLK
ncbi:MAG: hypothetical protein IPK88_11930 [Saprospiraceae bacterium]|nr:hypothetical protein [Candidatus Defluviibacterium haderslevense]